jgi:hypothetical protein
MHGDFGRGTRRILRQLANTAWERELDAELKVLASSFAEWKAGELGPHELSDRIHTFHHGAARDLYGLYTRVHPAELVARAVGLGILSEDEVPPHLREALANGIQYYRSEPPIPLDDDDSKSHD